MVRASLAADAPYVNATVHGDGLVSLQYRKIPGGETQEVKAAPGTVPVSLRLTRRGDLFTFFVARPGEGLAEAGSVTVTLPENAHAGLAVCSHEEGTLETAVFSSFELTEAASR